MVLYCYDTKADVVYIIAINTTCNNLTMCITICTTMLIIDKHFY